MSNTSDLTQGDALKLQAELEEWKEAKQEEKAHKKNQTIAGVVLSKKKLVLHTEKEEAMKKRGEIDNKITALKSEMNQILTQGLLAKVKKIKSKLAATFEEVEYEVESLDVGVKIEYVTNNHTFHESATMFLVTESERMLLCKITLDDDSLPTYLMMEEKKRYEVINSELESLREQFDRLNNKVSVVARNINNFDLIKEKITAQIDYKALDEEDKHLVAEIEESLNQSKLLLDAEE
jgi:hypothetical protein